MSPRRAWSPPLPPLLGGAPSLAGFLIGAVLTAFALGLQQVLPMGSAEAVGVPLYFLTVLGAAWLGAGWAALVAAIGGLVLVLPGGEAVSRIDWDSLPALALPFATALAGGALTVRLRAVLDQLAAERARYQCVLHSVGEILLVVDGEGRLEFFNRHAKDRLGLRLESLGRPLSQVLPLRRGLQAFDPLVEAAGHRTLFTLPDGIEADLVGHARLPLAGSIAPVAGNNGARGHVLSLRDTSELQVQTQRLARSEAKLRGLFDSELLAIYTMDLDGRVLSTNAAFLSLLGYADNEVVEQPTCLRELTPPECWPADEYAIAELAARGSCRPYGKVLLRRDGRRIQVTVGGAIVNRNEAAFFAIDAEARSEAEAQIAESRQLLQAIIDSIPAFVAYIDADMRYLIGNRHRLGHVEAISTQINRPLVQVFEHVHYVALAPHVRRALAGVAAHTTLSVDDEDGVQRQYAVQLQPRMSDDRQRVEGVVMHAFDITTQLQRQRALHDSEVRFRRLAEATSAIVCHLSSAGRILYLSGWRRFSGNEGIATDFVELYGRVHLADRPLLRRFLARCRRRQGPEEVEFRLRHASAEYRYVAVRAVPVPAADGGAEWVGSARDVHDKRSTLQRLQRTEQELRLILDTMPARIAFIEADGRFRWANRAFLEWFKPPGEIRGASMSEVFSSVDQVALGDAINRGFRGFPSQVEWMQEHPHWGARWSLTTVTPDIAADGTVAGCITLDTDHTERKRTEQALRRSNREHRALAESVPHMVWIAYGDGRMFYFNQRWRDYTGLSAVDAWHKAVYPEDRSAALGAFRTAVAHGSELAIELRLLRQSDGAARWHMMRAVPVADEGMKITRWYGTCTDIEDQKQAQRTLQRAQERTQQFLATLSHELRNPLAALMTSAHLLNRDDLPDVQRPLLAQTVRRQTVQLQRLVEDLLDISRITQGKVQLKLEDVELRRIVADVADDFAERAAKLEVTLRCEPSVGDDPHWVRGDAARLRQIVDNLVSNALKATPPGGDIRLSLRRDGNQQVISVSDSGPGIPHALMPRMWEPFVQGEAWRERGLGLGLSVVMRMTRLHDGDVRARNLPDGRGACFEIRLPAFDPQRPAHVQAPAPAVAEARPAARLLVIDDEIDHADALKMLLELHGYALQTANDGEQALQQLDRHRFDAVICDLGLPGEWNGYRLATYMRERLGDGVLLIAFSGYGAAEDVERALKAGFDSHLLKPSAPSDVLDALRNGLATKVAGSVS